MRSRSTSARSTATSCACALARSTNLRRATMSCRRRSAPVSLRPAAVQGNNGNDDLLGMSHNEPVPMPVADPDLELRGWGLGGRRWGLGG